MILRDLRTIATEGVSHDPAIQKQTIVRNGEVPHLLNFARARFEPGQVVKAHRHADMTEVFLVTEGTGELRVEGEAYPLAPGVCIVAEPGESHEIANTSSEVLEVTYFALEA